MLIKVAMMFNSGNKKGMGSSQNNLAAAELGLGNKNEAELYSKQAIRNAEELLRDVESRGGKGEDIDKARRVLSDRKGNLAIIYLQQDRFADAFEVLEQLLAEDKKNLYIRGLVVKQGTLGQYYLKQGELKSAEKIFRSALDFIRRKDENMFNSEWNVDVCISIFNSIVLSFAITLLV
jgi:tetratricopeptide (TPR) repeat protein